MGSNKFEADKLDRLHLVVDSMREGFGLLDADFTILELNAEAVRLDQRPRELLIGRSHWDVYPGTETGEVGRQYMRAMRDRVSVAFSHKYVWDDGRESWFDTRAYPTADGGLAVFYRDVTEQVDAQRKLNESEARFRAAIQAIDGILWTNDAGGEMRGEQSAWSALTGQSFEEYQGYGWAKAIHADDVGPTVEAWRKAVLSRSPFSFEHRVCTAAGVWRTFAIRAIPLMDENGDIREWVGVHRDITNLRNAEEHQRRDAAELSALYAEAPLGLAMIDAKLHFVRINAALASMNGFPVEEHIGKSVWDLVPDLRSSAEPVLRRVLESRLPVRNVTIRGRTAAQPGVDREWCEHFYPVRDAAGDIVGIGVVAEEVTEQRRQETALRDSEDELRRVLDQLFAFVGILKPDGTIAYANQTPLIAANIELASIMGRPFADAPWWSYDPVVQAKIETAINQAAKGNIVRYDIPVQLGATLAMIDFQIAPLRDRDGRITGLIPSGVIIDERVEAEAELRRLTEQLEAQVERRTAALNAANLKLTNEIKRRELAQEALVQSQKLEAMGRLVAGVSHDFNNILAAVSSGLSLIEKRIDDPTSLEMIQMSASAAKRGTGLVRQLMAFARQQPLIPQKVDLNVFFSEFRPIIDVSLAPGIQLKLHVDERCKTIEVDPGQLQSALLNLVVNARDAMPNGGMLTILAEPSQAIPGIRNTINITVSDTGNGMTESVLQRIAEPFFTTKEIGKGTGLGVAMVHGFVNQSGGTLRYESIVGKGTTVHITLPVSDDDGMPDSNMAVTPKQDLLKILVIDDDGDLRGITAATLIECGHDVVGAADAATALTLLAADHFDLLLTDVAMPDVDGIALAALVRASYSNLPIIFMTGNANRAELNHEIVVTKPFTTDDLTRAIHDTQMLTLAR